MNPPSPTPLIARSREAGSGCPSCSAEVAVGDPIAVCPSCGTVHHRPCWDHSGRCGAYSCAPARRDLNGVTGPVLAISFDEIARAAPLTSRAPAQAAPRRPDESKTGTNRLAIASLICALVGLIPIVGILTGLIAIVLAAVSLSAIRGTAQKGLGFAVSGLLLGLADVVGSILIGGVLLSMYDEAGADVEFVDSPPDLASEQGLDPEIRRGLRANVLIERRSGLLGGLAIGSGVILDITRGDALIVTNRHVIDPNFSSNRSGEDPARLGPLEVKMLGQTTSTGRVVWMAPGGIDLALVRAPCSAAVQAESARWVKARAMLVGAPVFAIGNPHRLGWTHTTGVISQFRTQRVGDRQVRLIQTQAAINPGNSGGGLYDREGYLLGINTMTSDKRVSEGISFAIALDTLLDLAPPELPPASIRSVGKNRSADDAD